MQILVKGQPMGNSSSLVISSNTEVEAQKIILMAILTLSVEGKGFKNSSLQTK